MKIVANISTFAEPVTLVKRAIPNKSYYAPFKYFKIWATGNKVFITGQDHLKSITCGFEAQIVEEGTILLPAIELDSLLNKLGPGELTLTHIEGESFVSVHSDYGQFKFMVAEEEFTTPNIPLYALNLTIDSEQLCAAISKTVYAAATDELKQVLAGARFTLNGRMEMAATDAHKLAITVIDGELTADKHSLTIPRSALEDLQWALGKLPNGEVNITVADKTAKFSLGNFSLTSRLIEGAYPDYLLFLPKKFNRRVTVERIEVLNAIALLSTFQDKTMLISMQLKPTEQQIVFSANNNKTGEGTTTVNAQIEGEYLDIGFNSKYLTQLLKAFSSQKILVELIDADKPTVWSDPSPPQSRCLLMPVQKR